MPSLTPPDEPGRLTISVVPASPATPRDSPADATPAAAHRGLPWDWQADAWTRTIFGLPPS